MSEDDYIYNSLTLRGYVPTDIYAVSGEPPPPVTQYLSTSGGTMKGPINMNGSPVMNLPAPVAFQDAGNKKYIDDHDALVSGDLQDFKKLVEEQLTVLKGSIIYAGTYNASNNTIDSVTPSGGAFLTVGSPLPAASAALEGFFVIVSTNGNGVAPAPTTQLFAGDWIISVGTKWTLILKNGVFQTASAVSSIPSGTLSATNVQNALNELDTEKFPVVGGTLTGPLTVPNLTVTSSCTVKDSLTVGDPGITIKNGTGADFGKTVIEVKPGKQLVVNGGFAVNGTDLTNPIPATRVSYDNTGSSLNVPNVQEGLFSLALKCDALGSNIPTLQNDVTALRTQTTALTGRVTNLETDLADVRVEADGTKVTVTALSTAVNAQTLAIEAIRTGYLPTTGGNLSGALQVAGGLSVGGSITIGNDASPFIVSKPNGTILNIDGPVGGKVISDVPISYSAAAEDLLVTKGYVDQSDSALSARISYLEGNVIFMGTYDAAVNKVEDVSAAGVGVYVPGQPLPKAIPSTERNYLIVSQGGTGTGEAPAVPLLGGDWLLSTGSAWKEIDINDTQYLPVLGGTMQGPINMGNNSITNIKTPVNPTDAAGKGYVDSQDVVVKAYADSQDVAVKAYTDTQVAAVSAELATVETQINGKLADLGENIQYGGTYNATSNTVVAISPLARGLLTVGAALPAPGPLLEKMFVLVSVAGTGTAPAPTQALVVNSWIYCTGTSWIYYPMTGSSGAVDASAVTYNGTGFPTDHNVASALNTAGTAITGLASEQDDLLNSAAVCWGTYDVVTNKVVTATPEGIKMGYVVGSTLPAGAAPDRAYYRVSADGTGTGAAVPNVPMKKNDWIYGNGTSWIYYPMTGSGGGTGAYLPLTGGTLTGSLNVQSTYFDQAYTIKGSQPTSDTGTASFNSFELSPAQLILNSQVSPTESNGRVSISNAEVVLQGMKTGTGVTGDTSMFMGFENVTVNQCSRFTGNQFHWDSLPGKCVPLHCILPQAVSKVTENTFTVKAAFTVSFPNAKSTKVPYEREDLDGQFPPVALSYWAFGAVTLEIKLEANGAATTGYLPLKKGFYPLCVRTLGDLYVNDTLYLDFIKTLNMSYYRGVFAKPKSSEALNGTGAVQTIKSVGKCELYDTSNLAAAPTDFGEICAYPFATTAESGIRLGLNVTTDWSAVTSLKTYYAVIQLPAVIEPSVELT